MDTGEGYLKILSRTDVTSLGGVDKMDTMKHYFRVGEEVTVKDSTFRVQRISPKGLRLKVLKWNRD